MKISVKKLHPDAIIPKFASHGAACFDLHAVDVCGIAVGDLEVLKKYGGHVSAVEVKKNNPQTISTGLAFEVPQGHVMLIFSRSGHGFNKAVRLSNCVGVIDSDYRGEIKVKLAADDNGLLKVESGDRIAQAMILPLPMVELVEVDELAETERGTGGFGSTGS